MVQWWSLPHSLFYFFNWWSLCPFSILLLPIEICMGDQLRDQLQEALEIFLLPCVLPFAALEWVGSKYLFFHLRHWNVCSEISFLPFAYSDMNPASCILCSMMHNTRYFLFDDLLDQYVHKIFHHIICDHVLHLPYQLHPLHTARKCAASEKWLFALTWCISQCNQCKPVKGWTISLALLYLAISALNIVLQKWSNAA